MKPWGWASAVAIFSLGAYGAFWLEQNPGLIRGPAESGPSMASDAPSPAAGSAGVVPVPLKAKEPSAEELALRTELAAEFLRVADVYEETSRFPPYSFPISAEALTQYQYNRYIPVNVPLKQPGGSGDAEIRVVLEKLHFEKGETIAGLAAVYGPDAADVRLSEVELLDRGNSTLMTAGLDSAGEGEYPIQLTPSANGAADWPADLLLRVKGSWGRRSVAAVAPVFLDDPIGEIDAVGTAYVEGAHLQIPVEADVDGPGFYVISANLYSAEGEPLVHIEHQAELSRFDDKTELQVHHSALRASGDEGPYELRDLMLRRLPAKPGERVRFGPTREISAEIPSFSFDRYSGAAYQDPLRQARLEFLRSAGQLK